MLRRLIALPRMHMRRLVGSASPRIRARFTIKQLSGVVCTQRAKLDPPDTDQSPRRKPSNEQEHADRCTRTAFKLACQGYIGRAAAALVRLPPVEIDVEQKTDDLRKLHPPGDPPTDVKLPEKPVHAITSTTASAFPATSKLT